jgi:hydrogenase maturation protease
MARTAVIGVGNRLMGDEGVGVHAVEYLRNPPPLKKGCDLLDAGTGGMALFHLLERYERVIIIDAADFGGRPGEVRTLVITPRNDMQFAPDSTQVSLHGTSLAGILQLAERLGAKMPHITIVAVQPEYIGYSMELSPTVKKALEKIVGALRSRQTFDHFQ